MRIVLRLLAALSLVAVLAAGVLVGQWLLPVEVSRTVDGIFSKGMENLQIDVGAGVSLHVVNRDRVSLPSGYHAVSAGALHWPAPRYNADSWILTAGCPATGLERCHIDLDVYVPGKLIVYIYSHPGAGTIVLDSDVDAHLER